MIDMKAIAELRAWAWDCDAKGDPLPLEFVDRLRALLATYQHAERLIRLLDRPGWQDQSARIDYLRERCSERYDVLIRRLGRTLRAGRLHGKISVRPILELAYSDVLVARFASEAESRLRNESLRRRLARSRRKRATLPQAEPRAQGPAS